MEKDCQDGSDEEDCEDESGKSITLCDADTHIMCDDVCLPATWRCDGDFDLAILRQVRLMTPT